MTRGEAIEGFNKRRKVIKRAGWQVYTNQRLAFVAYNEVAAQDIGTMASDGFKAPAHRFLSKDETNATLVHASCVGSIDCVALTRASVYRGRLGDSKFRKDPDVDILNTEIADSTF